MDTFVRVAVGEKRTRSVGEKEGRRVKKRRRKRKKDWDRTGTGNTRKDEQGTYLFFPVA